MLRWRRLALGLVLCSACEPGEPGESPPPPPAPAPVVTPDLAALEAELVAAHRATLHAHRTGDFQSIAAAASDPSLSVSRGRVDAVTRADVDARFRGYFSAATFNHYDDLQAPIVRVSDDGSLGWVIAKVRVEGRYRHDDGSHEPLDSTWGWIELYERKDGAWLRAGTVSDHDDGPTGLAGPLGTPAAAAAQILTAAETALGGRQALAAIRTIDSTAAVTSPRGPLTTRIVATADGRVHLEQHSPTGAKVITALADGVWVGDGERAEPGTTAHRVFALGHALHLALMSPTRLYTGAEAHGEARYMDRRAQVLQLADALGNPVRIFYDADTDLPLGLELVEPQSSPPEPILVEVGDWRPHGTTRAFHHAVFRHRGDEFVYTYEEIDFFNHTNTADPRLLRAPALGLEGDGDGVDIDIGIGIGIGVGVGIGLGVDESEGAAAPQTAGPTRR